MAENVIAGLVAPFTGAWIEITPNGSADTRKPVAPFTGAWIEIPVESRYAWLDPVAPFTGAWIEISHYRMFGDHD